VSCRRTSLLDGNKREHYKTSGAQKADSFTVSCIPIRLKPPPAVPSVQVSLESSTQADFKKLQADIEPRTTPVQKHFEIHMTGRSCGGFSALNFSGTYTGRMEPRKWEETGKKKAGVVSKNFSA
jgi:hypothetical protein